MIAAPFLSESDPLEKGEGSIDPLGLAPTYERLADRMLPAVTVRMSRVRFVTAMAVGAAIAENASLAPVAKDGVTTPGQVFEWAVVMAFVKCWSDLKDPAGIPGNQKVRRALESKQAVSPASYLSVPTVFGFSGVFRRLARHLGVLDSSDRLGDNGVALVRAWCEDQELPGFYGGGSTGAGRRFRDELTGVVAEGLRKVSLLDLRPSIAADLTRRLDPGTMGSRERECLRQFILERAGPPTFVAALVQGLRHRRETLPTTDEAGFLRATAAHAPSDLKDLLRAMDDFESLCRPISDAFDRLRWLATTHDGGALAPDDFANHPSVQPILPAIADGVRRMDAHMNAFIGDPVVPGLVDQYRNITTPRQLYDRLLDHHRRVQRAKPPSGKRPWFDEAANEGVFVRAAYTLDWPEDRWTYGRSPSSAWPYVHEYRIPTLSGFLADLGMLSSNGGSP